MVSGISAVLSTISLIGVLLAIAGVALAVVASSQGRSVRSGSIWAILGVVVFATFQLISRGVIVVQATEVSVVFRTLSGQLTEPRQEGTHIIIPVLEEAILYPTNVQEYTMSGTTTEGATQGDDAVRARSEDGQEVFMDITILYRVRDNAEVNELHRGWYNRSYGSVFNIDQFQNAFVRPTVRALVRDVTSQYTARQIYGETRSALRDEMAEVVRVRFDREGLDLTDLLLREVTFSEQFTRAIEQAQVAEQDALRAEIRVRETEQLARSTILNARADAESLRLISEQIAANPALIQYLYVQNLSDNVGIALVPANSPFLFDMASLPEAMENFSAPESTSSDDSTFDVDDVEIEVPGEGLDESESPLLPQGDDN